MMASSAKQTQDPLASGKDQENKISTIEAGYNFEEYDRVSSRKRKASGDGERNKKKHRGSSESSKNSNTCKPGNVSMEDVRTGPSKRKASPDRQTPSKRHKTSDTSPASNVLVDEVRDKGVKRKASADPQTPEKRQSVDGKAKAVASNTSTPKKVPLEDVKAEQQKACSGGETSKRNQKDSENPDREAENTLPKVNTSRADFEAKYQQLNKIGQGGCGAVYAGIRITDTLPVAIHHTEDPNVELEVNKIPLEVALMQRVSGGRESVRKSATVALLDWYYLDTELVLVMERPYPSMDLSRYLREQGGSMKEEDAKILMAQLVDAFIEMHRKGVFHRDIKLANILVDVSSTVPGVRIIDFGCGCFVWKKPYCTYDGTFSLAPPEWHVHKMYKAVGTTVWQLGALLYRLLHGYLFDTVSFVKGRIGLSSKLSQDCSDFLQLCLTIRPKERGKLMQLQQHPWLKQSNTT